MSEEMKRCPMCGEVKPLSEFHMNRTRKDGRQSHCKSCNNKSVRKYWVEHREEHHECNRKYNACVKRPSCPRVGGRGAEFMTFTCEVCGAEFRRRKNYVDYIYERRGILPRFCSNECRFASMRKGYKSPYARKIEEIKRRVRA